MRNPQLVEALHDLAAECIRVAALLRQAAPLFGAEQACRVCGCTDTTPCYDNGWPCHWIEADLCSASVCRMTAEPDQTTTYDDYLAKRYPRQPAEAPPQVPNDCECTLYARCDFHEAHKPKGCTCNGPYYAASCPNAAHAARGRAWPAGDPAAVV